MVIESQSNYKINERAKLTTLLLLYSFLPAFVKVFEQKNLFLLNLPIIAILFYGVKLSKKELIIVSILTFLVVLNYAYLSIINNGVNDSAYFQSIYISIVPMIGFFLIKKYKFDDLLFSFFLVSSCHAVFALLTSDFIIYPSSIQLYIDTIKEGSAYMRLSSVSGSIIFGVLMTSGFSIYIYLWSRYGKKFNSVCHILGWIIFISGILSLQRSCWLAMMLTLFLFSMLKSRNFIITSVLISFLIVFILPIFMSNDFYYERFLSLFSTNYNAVDERSMLWISALKNFSDNILGVGFGQVGIIGFSNEVHSNFWITDGDYLKILNEGGILYFILVMSIIIASFFSAIRKIKYKYDIVFLCITLGFFVQMIGSNISEFYYVNYVLWSIIGVNFYKSYKI